MGSDRWPILLNTGIEELNMEDHGQFLKKHGYEPTGVDMQCIMCDTTRQNPQLNNQADKIAQPIDFNHCCHRTPQCWNNGHMNGKAILAEMDAVQRHNIWVTTCLINLRSHIPTIKNRDWHWASNKKPSFKENNQSFGGKLIIFDFSGKEQQFTLMGLT